MDMSHLCKLLKRRRSNVDQNRLYATFYRVIQKNEHEPFPMRALKHLGGDLFSRQPFRDYIQFLTLILKHHSLLQFQANFLLPDVLNANAMNRMTCESLHLYQF